MPAQPRNATSRITRRGLLLGGLAAPLRQGLCAEALRPRLEGDHLRVSAPQLHFLTGKPLERLHNGASMAFDFQLSALADRPSTATTPRILERAVERFLMSYDLWEEKFSISRSSRPARSVSHLSVVAAEAWCLENLSLPAAALAPDKPFWLRLELRVEDPKDRPGVVADPGIILTRLIELFSRPSRSQQASWLVEDGPFRLADLSKAKGRGSGAG